MNGSRSLLGLVLMALGVVSAYALATGRLQAVWDAVRGVSGASSDAATPQAPATPDLSNASFGGWGSSSTPTSATAPAPVATPSPAPQPQSVSFAPSTYVPISSITLPQPSPAQSNIYGNGINAILSQTISSAYSAPIAPSENDTLANSPWALA